MNYQADLTTSILNESYTFQSVSGKNAGFAQSIQGTPFYFRSGHLASCSAFFVHAGGQIHYSVPVHFNQAPLPYSLMLFIVEGSGNVLLGEESVSVKVNEILILPSDTSCHFDTTHTPFSYYVFYLSGDVVADYLSLLCTNHSYFKRDFDKTNTIICGLLPNICKQLASEEAEASLHLSAMFHIIFSTLLDTCKDDKKAAKLPAHVAHMKQLYDFEYSYAHSLESLESDLGISKYRLCRDFSAYIGISPVQYLNQVRLREARHLLCTTDLTIREVGISVGIENTTHFINLFKKNTGITPLQFRQNHKL